MSDIDIKGLQDALDGLSGDDTVLLKHTVLRALLDRLESAERALADVMSWVPEKPEPAPVWSFRAGEYGADDAIDAARDHIKKYGSTDHD